MSVNWSISNIIDPKVHLDHEEAVREIRSEKLHRGEQVRAALYTYRACYVTKTVGPGSGRSYQQYADELGYSKGYVTRLRRLGRAIVVHKVSPDSKLFSMLRTTAVRKEVGELLELDIPQPHDRLRRVIEASGPDYAAGSQEDLETLLARIRGVVADVLTEASRDQLALIEDAIGDLFFEVRAARKVRRAT